VRAQMDLQYNAIQPEFIQWHNILRVDSEALGGGNSSTWCR